MHITHVAYWHLLKTTLNLETWTVLFLFLGFTYLFKHTPNLPDHKEKVFVVSCPIAILGQKGMWLQLTKKRVENGAIL